MDNVLKKIEGRMKYFNSLSKSCKKIYDEKDISSRVRAVAYGKHLGFSEAAEELRTLYDYIKENYEETS